MIEIYLTNLGRYNEGDIVGQWLSLPLIDDMEQVLEEIEIDGKEYEEYFITDYQAPEGFTIHEYSNLNDLNEIAERLNSLQEYDLKALKLLLATGEFETDLLAIEEALNVLENGSFRIYSNCDDMSDVAAEIIEIGGHLDQLPEHLRYYFDFQSYGEQLDRDGHFFNVGNSTIVELF